MQAESPNSATRTLSFKTLPKPKSPHSAKIQTLKALLGGSWAVISWVISPLIWVMTLVILLITLLITTHEPPIRP